MSNKKDIKNKKKQSPALSREGVGVGFSIIIPNYNGQSFLNSCLSSLVLAIKNCPHSQFEIILIDNNSQDQSLKIFEDTIPKDWHFKILLNKTNQGFAPAVNQGIKQTKHEYVVLLNNDLIIKDNWFKLISKEIINNQNHKITTFFGTILNKDGSKFESQGLNFSYSGKCQNISNNKPFSQKDILNLKSKIIWGASAALVVYHKKTIETIGLFDEDFFAYEEDVDLSLRLNNFKFKTLYIPQAISFHLGGGTSNKMGIFRNKMDAKNWIFLIIKNFTSKEILNNLPKIIEQRLRNLSGLTKKTINYYGFKSIIYLPYILISTYGEVLLKIPTMIKKRKNIQKLLKYTQ